MAQFIQRFHADKSAIRDELLIGLQAPQASTSPKYLYDALGSKLFEAICELPEYYPTRTEAAIFDAHADEIAASVGRGRTLVDLGAGNCAKAGRLFPVLQPAHYVPIDISVDFLRDSVDTLQQRFPEMEITALGVDFSAPFALPDNVGPAQRLFFYPGSSIGNFSPDDAVAFLSRLAQAGDNDGALLISVDLVKAKPVLDAAYDDALGVTASFNLNLLNHLNEVLEADFNVRGWQHVGFFNAELSRIEMHLEAKTAQTVRWRGGHRDFAAGERIHTENSYKYTAKGFTALLERAGYTLQQAWIDPLGWFMVCHAKVSGNQS
ncbi:L-histidine N(alpha)-methyltransferase [Actimicrobium sp. CCI2.3]|uniref:L-histidine N(alpha)-methyltransferase n=1 Tax=Actimicrobium sp. CCI2.3 TaxID=3048616 RepID=UPI002AB5668C|nr:L-histidine N(alpha)-methyltransferase [Actimicrobium sp. CCI2.3]MDY7574104.1 L-histidine N(alpha)-methyltransferase [Actimicrobium sp. CCI2.3]MEB0023234.1 L-histidine N(alpha)-methyltransferase [Actimicrobium sp. CCI2.3]